MKRQLITLWEYWRLPTPWPFRQLIGWNLGIAIFCVLDLAAHLLMPLSWPVFVPAWVLGLNTGAAIICKLTVDWDEVARREMNKREQEYITNALKDLTNGTI